MAVKKLITHKWVTPKYKVYAFFKELNNTTLSFGVHAEDNDKHKHRDRQQQKPLHKAYYRNQEQIGNAELLEKTESGFTTTVNGYDGRPVSVEVPPRPILHPMFEKVRQENYSKCIGKAFKNTSAEPIKKEFKRVARKDLNVQEYVEEQEWENSETTKTVKNFEWRENLPFMTKDALLQIIWDTQEAEKDKGVLEDSGDLLKSIKAKVK